MGSNHSNPLPPPIMPTQPLYSPSNAHVTAGSIHSASSSIDTTVYADSEGLGHGSAVQQPGGPIATSNVEEQVDKSGNRSVDIHEGAHESPEAPTSGTEVANHSSSAVSGPAGPASCDSHDAPAAAEPHNAATGNVSIYLPPLHISHTLQLLDHACTPLPFKARAYP